VVIPFEDPGDENLRVSEKRVIVFGWYEQTMPRANKAPRPRTTPYPQPTLRGGAIGILIAGAQSLKN
jgi:hypothetical protein